MPRLFKPGQSGNPGGLTKRHREVRKKVAQLLEDALVVDNHDRLIEAIVDGVQARDSTCIKLACEYRWGKPMQPVEVDIENMDDQTLKREVMAIAKQWEAEDNFQ